MFLQQQARSLAQQQAHRATAAAAVAPSAVPQFLRSKVPSCRQPIGSAVSLPDLCSDQSVWSLSSSSSTSRQSWRCCSTVAAAAAAAGGGGAEKAAAVAAQAAGVAAAAQEWTVLNFYHLVDIADPEEMLARHKAFIASKGLDSICGRIYISKQGINCQGGGLKGHAEKYVEWVGAQPEFQGLFHTLWPTSGRMFPKLRLKLKPNLISLAGGMQQLPCTDPAMRATPLQPAEWREKMAHASAVNAAAADAGGQPGQKKRVVVMDLRNDYEWDAGHFDWAPRPDEEVFAETPVPAATAAAAAAAVEESSDDEDDGVPGEADDMPSPLRGADPENTEVLMYCTGGIRCDVYSAALRQKGFKNLFTLHGGIQNYLREEGNEHWRGSLFVFDGRMAINPALQQGDEDVPLPAAVPCQLCGSEATLPHINCANMDCNELFIACPACKTRFHGCCCEACQSAPRLLRPIKVDGGNYGSWASYADVDSLGPVISTKRAREGRVARRARRREAMKAKREAWMADKRAMRSAMKAAMKAAAAQEAEDAGDDGEGAGQADAGRVAVRR